MDAHAIHRGTSTARSHPFARSVPFHASQFHISRNSHAVVVRETTDGLGAACGGCARVFFIGWILPEVSTLYEMKVLVALFGIVAAVLAISGLAWLRICIVNRPTFVCCDCGYDLRGCVVPSAPCPECGSELRRTEARAFRTSSWGLWILIPGVVQLLLGATACAAGSSCAFLIRNVAGW